MYNDKSNTAKKNILVIGTGGTIAGTGEQNKTSDYQSAQIKVDKLVSEIPGIEHIANVKSEDIFKIDSCDMTFKKLIQLSKRINELAEDENIDGFVITHGTDTMEETAYFLNLVLKTNKPVVLTGSMRPGTSTSADGPFNIYQAVALAQSEEAIGKGVLVVFSDTIYSARNIAKTDTYRTYAFGHKDLGCLGYMRDNNVFFYNSPVKKHTLESKFDLDKFKELPKVEILNFYVDADIDMLDYLSKNCKGIILSGVGCGGCSTQWNNKIEEILALGIPVVRSSRIINGLVTHSKSEILKKGIYSNNLSPQKSRILLSLALTQTDDFNKIQEIFETY